ncbi:MAG TPA: alginate lyase family protein [Candidatus Acidoferrales bacterium]|nr:alginate lyase family protein [Candidatus Acidoferrales bacterium]
MGSAVDGRVRKGGVVRLRRLLNMGMPELICRGRHAVAKRMERIGLLSAPSLRLDGDASTLIRRVRGGSASGFFPGAVSEQVPTVFAAHMPEACDQTMAAAEAICQKCFNLLGYHGLSFGNPVNWHLDPISGHQAPLVHWSRLDPTNAAAVGDMKVVWELNRHQWLVHLGQAYRLTGDERYAEMFATYVREWIRANPAGLGINWTSSLELALRLISWCWALFLFQRSDALSRALFVEMLEGIWTHAAHIERYLSYYFSPNTHLTGEALALFYVGVVFPELPAARRWQALGTRILVRESKRQVLPDGVYFEQSTSYQRYTVEIYLHFLILAARNGVVVPPDVAERVQRMLDFLLAVRCPDGSIPQIGDADGGWLLPLTTRAPGDFRGVFSTAAAFFGRSDYAWAAEGPTPEALWLLGTTGTEAFGALRPALPEITPSPLFAEGGYAVMRSGWDAHAHHLIFDLGPLGCPISGGHGHADLLSFQCSIFGVPYLVDPGTYGYTAEPEWRDMFRSTAAHNTVTIDGVGQAVPAGPFRWGTRPQARLHRWLSTDAFDLADASHSAYCRLQDPVVHRRRVIFVKPRYWVVVDDVVGAAEHSVELHFQFAPMEVTVDPALWARARGPQGHALLIRPLTTIPLRGEVHTGKLAPIRGWVSPHYGQRQPAPVLTYSAVAQLPLRIVTLLLPTQDPHIPTPPVATIGSDRTGPAGLIFENTGEAVYFDERGPVTRPR